MRTKKEGRINRVRETQTDGQARASILDGGQPRLTTWYRTQKKLLGQARNPKGEGENSWHSHHISNIKLPKNRKQGRWRDRARKERRRRRSNNIAIDAGSNPSIETSFPNGSLRQPRKGKKPAEFISMQQRSGEMENDTARLLPRGKSDETCSKISCADTSSNADQQHTVKNEKWQQF